MADPESGSASAGTDTVRYFFSCKPVHDANPSLTLVYNLQISVSDSIFRSQEREISMMHVHSTYTVIDSTPTATTWICFMAENIKINVTLLCSPKKVMGHKYTIFLSFFHTKREKPKKDSETYKLRLDISVCTVPSTQSR
jgi:hypothetical protein